MVSGLPIFFYLISTISRDDGDELSWISEREDDAAEVLIF